jgi:hypothetical protein
VVETRSYMSNDILSIALSVYGSMTTLETSSGIVTGTVLSFCIKNQPKNWIFLIDQLIPNLDFDMAHYFTRLSSCRLKGRVANYDNCRSIILHLRNDALALILNT